MTLQRIAASLLTLSALLSTACDVEDETSLTALEDTDDLEARDLSAPFIDAPVLIENIDDGTCLSVDPSYSPYPWEVACDPSDTTQHFVFDVQTYVGGIGFVYKVCAADHPTECLMHVNNGTVFFDPGAPLGGFSYNQVRIQHDEDQAFIEFRRSGRCLTPGAVQPTPTAGSCRWFGSTTQHYRLQLVDGEGSCEDRCGSYDASESCQCDAACTRFGDCCDDRATVCGG